MKDCTCQLCKAEELTKELKRFVHPWELIKGVDSVLSFYIRKYHGKPIYVYERLEKKHAIVGREVDIEELKDDWKLPEPEWYL